MIGFKPGNNLIYKNQRSGDGIGIRTSFRH